MTRRFLPSTLGEETDRRCNTQGELHPLEEGLHALGSGLSVREYAAATNASPGYVTNLRQAAEVFAHANTKDDLSERARHLAEVHSAPRWIWSALVSEMIYRGWNLDAVRSKVAAMKQMRVALQPWGFRKASGTRTIVPFRQLSI
jgi:hypothetical protein